MTSITDRNPAELYCPICEQHFEDGELCPNDGNRLVRLANQIDPFLGRELDGRFSITEKLGQGGMGSVYRARQHSVDREIAIKVIHPGMVSDPSSIKRFLREAKIASRLAHPNIVAVMDFGQAKDGVFWLAMELVEGRTLQDVIAAEGPFPLARLVRVAVQICDALEGAHAIPIVHRDLKPANIMMIANSRDLVKVLDFGLAKSLALDATNNTMTGALLGTPAFMPPELANGETCDGRADLYSLGCILYLLGTGHPPFETDSVPEMIAMHGTQDAPPMTGVPTAIAEVIDRLLAKRPEDRYPSAVATRAALEAAYEESRASGAELEDATKRYTPAPDLGLDSGPRSAINPVTAQTVITRRRRPRKLFWGTGLAIVIAIGVAIGIGLAGRDELVAHPPPRSHPIPAAAPAFADAAEPDATEIDAAIELDAAAEDDEIELVDAAAVRSKPMTVHRPQLPPPINKKAPPF